MVVPYIYVDCFVNFAPVDLIPPYIFILLHLVLHIFKE